MSAKINCSSCIYYRDLSNQIPTKSGKCIYNPPNAVLAGGDKLGRPMSVAFYPGVGPGDLCGKHPLFDHSSSIAALHQEEKRADGTDGSISEHTARLKEGSHIGIIPKGANGRIPDDINRMVDEAAGKKPQ